VIGGWFPLINSVGLPLEIVLHHFQTQGLVPDWPDFIEEALKCDWNPHSLRTRIENSVGDVYGPDHKQEVLKRYDIYLNTRM